MSLNQFLKCENALKGACVVGDVLTSPLLQELSGVNLAAASSYLRKNAGKGRIEFIGKAISAKGGPKTMVYRIKEEFFTCPIKMKGEEVNCNRTGGKKGRTWENKDGPLIFL